MVGNGFGFGVNAFVPYGKTLNQGTQQVRAMDAGSSLFGQSTASSLPGGLTGLSTGSVQAQGTPNMSNVIAQMLSMFMSMFSQVFGGQQGGQGNSGGNMSYGSGNDQSGGSNYSGNGNINYGAGAPNGNINFGGNGNINFGYGNNATGNINYGGNGNVSIGLGNNAGYANDDAGDSDNNPQPPYGGNPPQDNGNYAPNGNTTIINNIYNNNNNCPPSVPPAKDCPPAPQPPKPPAYKGGKDASFHGDPHLVGFDGEKYDVTGKAGKTYNMLSDDNVQYNTTFASWGKNGATVVSAAGIQVGDNKIKYDNNDVAPYLNGKAMTVGQISKFDGGGSASWDGTLLNVDTGEYDIDLYKVDSKNGDYLNSNVRINKNPMADGVDPHGLLGQTADNVAGKKNTGNDQGKQGGTVIDGTIKDYQVDGLFDNGFKYNRFDAEIGYPGSTAGK